MFFIPKILALGALATSVLGAPAGTPTYRGSFIIQNNCKDNITVQDSTIKGDKLIWPSTAMSILYNTDDRYTFIAPGDVRGKLTDNKVPRLIFAYQLQQGSNEHVIYQISNAYGEPFKGKQVTVDTPDNECPKIDWPEGLTTGRTSGTCDSKNTVTLSVCGDTPWVAYPPWSTQRSHPTTPAGGK